MSLYNNINKHNAGKSALLFLGMVLVLVLPFLFGVRYYNTDDLFRRQMVVGSYQFSLSPHLIHSSTFLGDIYIDLYKHFPALEWYKIIHVSVCFIFWLCTYRYIFSYNPKKNILAFVALTTFMVLVGRNMLTEVHFTTASCLLAIASAFLFRESLKNGRKLNTRNIVATMLLFWACAFRMESAILLFVFANIAISIDDILFNKSSLRNAYKVFFSIAVICSISIFPNLVSRWMEPKEIKDFRTYASSFRNIFDYHFIQKSGKKTDILKQAQWDTTDLKMLQAYIIPRREEFGLQRVIQLDKAVGPISLWSRLDKKHFQQLIQTCFVSLEYHFPFLLFLFLGFAALIKRRYLFILEILCMVLIVLILYIVLTILYKIPPEYLSTPIFTIVFLVLLMRMCCQFTGYRSSINFISLGLMAGLLLVVKKNTSEAIAFIKELVPKTRSSEFKYGPISKDKKLICLSMRNHDYVYPSYNDMHWWRTQDLQNIIYMSPYTFHPSEINGNLAKEGDLILRSINNKEYYWGWGHGYEYDTKDMELILKEYIHKNYGLNTRFQIDSLSGKNLVLTSMISYDKQQ